MNPQHRSFARIALKTKAERIYSVIKNLDPLIEHFLTLTEQAGDEPLRTAYGIFRLLSRHPRSVILSAVRETLRQALPRFHFLQTLISGSQSSVQEQVRPHHQELLDINYQPRSLEEYSA